MMHRLERSLVLPINLAEAWDFFSNPLNLGRITPPEMKMRVCGKPAPEMYAGMLISYSVSPMLNLPLNWVSEITHVEAPYYFVDEQRYGPYRIWHHEHRFREHPSGVEAIDSVDYLLPLGPLGRAIHALSVRSKLEHIFNYREKTLLEIFGSTPKQAGQNANT